VANQGVRDEAIEGAIAAGTLASAAAPPRPGHGPADDTAERNKPERFIGIQHRSLPGEALTSWLMWAAVIALGCSAIPAAISR
jgi:hypothetical protein